MGGFTSNRREVQIGLAILLVITLGGLAWCSQEADAAEVFAQVQHSSTGGSTDVNSGRNFPQVGLRLPASHDGAFSVAVGRYLIGSADCATSMSLGYYWPSGWEWWLTTYGDGRCTRGDLELDFEGNIGTGMGYGARLGRFQIAWGAGLWHHPDEAVHELPFDQRESLQLTAYIALRGRIFRWGQ